MTGSKTVRNPRVARVALPLVALLLVAVWGCNGRNARARNVVESALPSHEITVPNGGFEEGTAMWSVGFGDGTDSPSLSGSKTYEFTASADAHSGKKAALLSVRGGLYCEVRTNAPDYVPIDKTGTYTLSVFLKTEGRPGFAGSVYLGATKGSNGDFPQTLAREKKTPLGKDGYHEYLLEGIYLSANDRVLIGIGVWNDTEGESRLFVDEVRLFLPGEGTG